MSKKTANVAVLFRAKWTIEILYVMREGPVRLSELRRKIPLASKKALTSRLRVLEAAHVILRRDLSNTVLHVEYAITDGVREPLIALLDSLLRWESFDLSESQE